MCPHLDATNNNFLLSVFFSPQDSIRAFEHPGFIMRLVLEGDTVKFEPDFKDFEVLKLFIVTVYSI